MKDSSLPLFPKAACLRNTASHYWLFSWAKHSLSLFNLLLSLHSIQILCFYFIVLICFFCVVFRFLKLSFIAASCWDLSALFHSPSCTTCLKMTTFLNPLRSSIFLVKHYDLFQVAEASGLCEEHWFTVTWVAEGFFMFTKKLFLRVYASFPIVCVWFFFMHFSRFDCVQSLSSPWCVATPAPGCAPARQPILWLWVWAL